MTEQSKPLNIEICRYLQLNGILKDRRALTILFIFDKFMAMIDDAKKTLR